MLYTRKGDKGTSALFGSKERIPKNADIFEALGSLDEVNSFLGLCKVKFAEKGWKINEKTCEQIVHEVQETLFIIQAELAGSEMKVGSEKVLELETLVGTVEAMLPPIKTFFISGGSECGALSDTARTLVRRAERRAVAVLEKNPEKLSEQSLAYLNRLSSLLYALARLSNHISGIKEQAPGYK